jgi:DNA-binding XRE family transcriptional regulator
LPFCHFKIKAEKLKASRYPKEIRILGDPLRARRLDLGLRQKDVARLLDVTRDSGFYIETARVQPSEENALKVMRFVDK